jgi:pimeloyl-ACP methyl ester carboxylesterase
MTFKNMRLVFASLFLFALTLTPTAHATGSDRPILFVHGFNPFGIAEDCKLDWSNMEANLTAQGFTGLMKTVGYYSYDTNCDALTSTKSNMLWTIQELSTSVAWYIYNTYSSQNTQVDVVAHSMGGIIIRYALYRISQGDVNFPPFLKINHVTTIASPFEGYAIISEACHIVAINTPCWQMAPYSPFITDLNVPAAETPQGADGTVWASVGSNADPLDDSDGLVQSSSATSQPIPTTSKLIMPWYKLVFHTMYTHNQTVINFVSNSLSDAEEGATRAIASVATPEVVTEKADFVISRADAIEDVTQLSADQRPGHVEANLGDNGEPAGVQVTGILPSGIFAKMGIEEGDIVQGCSAQNQNQPFELFESLAAGTQTGKFKLCIERNGQSLTRVVAVQ